MGLAQQQAASCCLHQVSWILSLEFLEGQVNVSVGAGKGSSPALALALALALVLALALTLVLVLALFRGISPILRPWGRDLLPSHPRCLLQG